MLLVYVDDLIITSNAENEMNDLKIILSRRFVMKDLRELKYFLGVKVEHNHEGVKITQHNIPLIFLRGLGLLDAN